MAISLKKPEREDNDVGASAREYTPEHVLTEEQAARIFNVAAPVHEKPFREYTPKHLMDEIETSPVMTAKTPSSASIMTGDPDPATKIEKTPAEKNIGRKISKPARDSSIRARDSGMYEIGSAIGGSLPIFIGMALLGLYEFGLKNGFLKSMLIEGASEGGAAAENMELLYNALCIAAPVVGVLLVITGTVKLAKKILTRF